jgi:alpha-beta hydrolase superfamily lysophospholipase
VVLAPPVGFEARCARQALRSLAHELARHGFVALRLDYAGTGDSCGDFGDFAPDPQWLDDVASAVGYLRSSSIGSVSVVGMRLGALIASVAASRLGLDLASLVLWDPCESGRSYLRELRALESLRRENFLDSDGGAVETAEFLFPGDIVTSLRGIDLAETAPSDMACRTLVVTRSKRPLSPRLRQHLELGKVDFETTDEQEALLDTLPFYAATPMATIERIVEWIAQSGTTKTATPEFIVRPTTLIATRGTNNVVERATRLGPRQLFALISEPEHGAHGPWIVLFGGIHEDHNGPSRLWVELSRRWAASGLRCVRVDVTGMGESPRPASEAPVQNFDPIWVDDALTLSVSLDPADPTNVVYIGMCSGGFLAIESALATRARGMCVVNPPIGSSYLHALTRLEHSTSAPSRWTRQAMRRLFNAHHWVAALLWQVVSHLLPRRWAVDVMRRIVANGTDVYVLGSIDDLSPYPKLPLLRSIEGRRLGDVKPYPFVLVPELDHDMVFALGRARTTALLEEHVRSHFAASDSTSSPREDS